MQSKSGAESFVLEGEYRQEAFLQDQESIGLPAEEDYGDSLLYRASVEY